MEKKSQVSEQNFTEGKALHYLCSVMQCIKLSFMITNFKKWREVMVLNFLNLVLKGIEKLWKMIFKNTWEPWVTRFTLHSYGIRVGLEIPQNPQARPWVSHRAAWARIFSTIPDSVTNFTLHLLSDWRVSDSLPLAYLRERICELDIGAFLHYKDSKICFVRLAYGIAKAGE